MWRKFNLFVMSLGILIVVAALGVILGVLSTSDASNATTAALPKPPEITVNWQENGANHQRFVQIIQGTVSSEETGVVKTDTNCTPDTQGLSYCHNIIAIAHKVTVTVTDIHNMQHYRCLRVGETVILKPVNLSWAKVVVQ